jgi:GNAT superfamily N-acetyltransferase
MEGYALRAYANDDTAFISECMKASILMSVPEYERRISDVWMDDILSVTSMAMEGGMMRSDMMVLVNDEGERAGIIWMGVSKDQFTCEDTGYILGLYVIEGSRGKGLGKALINCAEDWCILNDLPTMTLNAGSPNKKAMELYSRLGFEERSTVMRKRIR